MTYLCYQVRAQCTRRVGQGSGALGSEDTEAGLRRGSSRRRESDLRLDWQSCVYEAARSRSVCNMLQVCRAGGLDKLRYGHRQQRVPNVLKHRTVGQATHFHGYQVRRRDLIMARRERNAHHYVSWRLGSSSEGCCRLPEFAPIGHLASGVTGLLPTVLCSRYQGHTQ